LQLGLIVPNQLSTDVQPIRPTFLLNAVPIPRYPASAESDGPVQGWLVDTGHAGGENYAHQRDIEAKRFLGSGLTWKKVVSKGIASPLRGAI
jgi:hypothetical protein